MKTTMVTFALGVGLQLIVITVLWLQHRKLYSCMKYWVIGYLLIFINICLVVSLNPSGSTIVIIASNALYIAGIIMLLFGVEKFYNKPLSIRFNSIFYFLVIFLIFYFTAISNSLKGRLLTTAGTSLIIWIECEVIILFRIDSDDRKAGRQLGIFVVLLALNTVGRILLLTRISTGQIFMSMNVIYALSYIISHILMFGFSFSLMLVINLKLRMQLESSLDEKKMYLKEIHHRIKNNLSIVSSLLEIQAVQTEDIEAKTALLNSRNRVQTMSIIHESLYQPDMLTVIDMKRYFTDLIAIIIDGYSLKENVTVEINVSDIFFDNKLASSLGLIVNELITNSIKYAFGDDNTGKIKIELKSLRGGNYELFAEDNGRGLPSNFSLDNTKSLGLSLVKSIVTTQLGGSIEFQKRDGAACLIRFKQ